MVRDGKRASPWGVAAVLVALLAAPGCGTGASPGAGPSPTGTARPGAETPGAAPSPAASPSPAIGPLACSAVTGTVPSTGTPVLSEVTVTALAGYDAVTFTFTPVGHGSPPPAPTTFSVGPAQPPFVRDGSGAPVGVTGTAFVRVRFHDAYGYDPINPVPQATYAGPTDLPAGLRAVAEVRETGDFEGYLTWVVGLANAACWRVQAGENRLEVDVPT